MKLLLQRAERQEISENALFKILLIRTRRNIRKILCDRNSYFDRCHQMTRSANRLKATENPFNIRRAERIELDLKNIQKSKQEVFELHTIGRILMNAAPAINIALSQQELMELLEINEADRYKIEADDGIIEMAVKQLENSAYHRKSALKEGPLYVAVMDCIHYELIHNELFSQKVDELVFGHGGIFEFVPAYEMTPDGKLTKQRPKLRIADKCDRKADELHERKEQNL